jgi:hypothetical protein
MKIAHSFTKAFFSCIKCGIAKTDAPVPNHPHELATAVKHQSRIGTHKMLQGFLSRSWRDALQTSGFKGNHQLGLKHLHLLLWNQLFQRIWDTRNFVLKKTPNRYNAAEGASLEQKLNWYREHRQTLLSLQDRHLANKDEEEIKKMGRLTRRKWVQHLDRLHEIHMKKSTPRDDGQIAITQHFEIIKHKKCSRQAGARKPKQAQKKKKQLTQSTLDSTIAITKRKRTKRTNNSDHVGTLSNREVQTRLQFMAGTAQPQRRDRPHPPEEIEPD